MSRLPDTDCCAVRLNLINITPFDPNLLGHGLRLDGNRLLNHDWLLNYNR